MLRVRLAKLTAVLVFRLRLTRRHLSIRSPLLILHLSLLPLTVMSILIFGITLLNLGIFPKFGNLSLLKLRCLALMALLLISVISLLFRTICFLPFFFGGRIVRSMESSIISTVLSKYRLLVLTL